MFGGSSNLGRLAKGTITPQVATVAPRQTPPRYGIREKLNLTHVIQAGAGALGQLHWSMASETSSNQFLTYTGGAGILTVTNAFTGAATYDCPGYPAAVTLELRKADNTVLDRKTFNVIAPDQATTFLVQFGNTHHVQGYGSIAFEAVAVLGPPDVCFAHVLFQEAYGTVTVTAGTHREVMTNAGSQHAVSSNAAGPVWLTFRNMVALGSRLNGYDTVGNWGIRPPASHRWAPGDRNVWATAEWPIQWRYKVAGMTPDTGVTFKYARHETWVYSTGEVELKKAGVEVRAALNHATDNCHAWSNFQDASILIPWPVTPRPAPPA
jgi:hypothetical protein